MNLYITFAQVVLALSGFYISRKIYKHTVQKVEPLVCPLNMKCDVVVHSKFGKTFGIDNSVMGIIYYGGMALVYFVSLFIPAYILVSRVWTDWLVLPALGSALFSLYLLSVMTFKLKEFCSWCILSALVSLTMAGVALFVYIY